MKKVVWLLFAALLVVALPVAAMAKTEIYKAKDGNVDVWEYCPYVPKPAVYEFPPYFAAIIPVGPAYEFGKDVWIRYVGTEKFNARVKNRDVGWNRNVHGTAYIYPVVGGGPVLMMAAMSEASNPSPTQSSPSSVLTMYPYSCLPPEWVWWTRPPNPSTTETLYSGPFQIEEVVQDDGGNFGCFAPSDPVVPVNFQDCSDPYGQYHSSWKAVDYLMLHVKITGNKIYFWKTTIHEPGVMTVEDHRGTDYMFTY